MAAQLAGKCKAVMWLSLRPWKIGITFSIKRGIQKKDSWGQELCESSGGRPGLPVPNGPYGLCGRKATLNLDWEEEE